jgi:membrane protease YdiL (CAAX protease family)
VVAVFFVIIPIIFNKLILKRKLSSIGLGIGSWKQGVIWGGICLIAGGIILFGSIYFFNFLKHYTIQAIIAQNYKNFLFYEFVYVLPIVFVYEFFFRGFIMLTIEIKTYYWAIVAQALVFFILILATKSFVWALFPYIIGAPLAGIVAYKSRSIFYSTGFQFIMIIILDAGIVRLIK